MQTPTTLDQLSLRQNAEILAIDWEAISEAEGRRLRALGIDEGVSVEKLHKGMFGMSDPIALKVGRMMIAIRRSHAKAISVQPVAVTIAA
ncbi:ferrous iron transport protein A [Sphingorhabdus sp. SMR4y]|uniref:FeoA family protein n=1 Tax=Sphingorhabdus sp. SMR4y TaxID=2584094 RepID=UPI000B5C5455|nr:FeoA family protein [Sphingorhabdus sp. SMR4y]ASK90062.1 FeoA domain protein [Sphingorhabdus sp. SMR4y]